MDLKPVESSSIEGIGYDPATATLRVKFKGGGTYEYGEVTPQHHADLTSAKSVGGHLRKHIRPHFKHTKIED